MGSLLYQFFLEWFDDNEIESSLEVLAKLLVDVMTKLERHSYYKALQSSSHHDKIFLPSSPKISRTFPNSSIEIAGEMTGSILKI